MESTTASYFVVFSNLFLQTNAFLLAMLSHQKCNSVEWETNKIYQRNKYFGLHQSKCCDSFFHICFYLYISSKYTRANESYYKTCTSHSLHVMYLYIICCLFYRKVFQPSKISCTNSSRKYSCALNHLLLKSWLILFRQSRTRHKKQFAPHMLYVVLQKEYKVQHTVNNTF